MQVSECIHVLAFTAPGAPGTPLRNFLTSESMDRFGPPSSRIVQNKKASSDRRHSWRTCNRRHVSRISRRYSGGSNSEGGPAMAARTHPAEVVSRYSAAASISFTPSWRLTGAAEPLSRSAITLLASGSVTSSIGHRSPHWRASSFATVTAPNSLKASWPSAAAIWVSKASRAGAAAGFGTITPEYSACGMTQPSIFRPGP